MNDDSWVMMSNSLTNDGRQCLTTSRALNSKMHVQIAQLHRFNNQPLKGPSLLCNFNSYRKNLAKSQCVMASGEKENGTSRALNSIVHVQIAQLNSSNNQPLKGPSLLCNFNSYRKNLAKSQCVMASGEKEKNGGLHVKW